MRRVCPVTQLDLRRFFMLSFKCCEGRSGGRPACYTQKQDHLPTRIATICAPSKLT